MMLVTPGCLLLAEPAWLGRVTSKSGSDGFSGFFYTADCRTQGTKIRIPEFGIGTHGNPATSRLMPEPCWEPVPVRGSHPRENLHFTPENTNKFCTPINKLIVYISLKQLLTKSQYIFPFW